MRKLIIIIFLFPFYNLPLLVGQEFSPVFENISDGLPSTEVHDIFQDSIGFMWFATDRGICRYDGDRFKTNDIVDEATSNSFFKFFKQSNSKVWVLNGDMHLFWFDPLDAKVVLHPFEQNDKLKNEIVKHSKTANISELIFTKDGMNISFRRNLGYLEICKNKCEWHFPKIPYLKKHTDNFDLEIIRNHGLVYMVMREGELKKKGIGTHSVVYKGISFSVSTNSTLNSFADFGVSSHLTTKFGDFVGVSDMLFRSWNGKVELATIPARILKIIHYNGELFVATFKGVYQLDKDMRIVKHFLQNHIITNLFIDKEKNMWLSSYDNGVFKYNHNSNLVEYKSPLSAHIISASESGVLVSDKVLEHCLVFDHNKRFLGNYDKTILRNNVRTQNKEFPLALSKIGKFQEISFLKIYPLSYGYRYFLKESDLQHSNFFIDVGALFEVVNREIRPVDLPNRTINMKFLFKNKPNELIIGSDEGLFKMEISSRTLSRKPLPKSENLHFYKSIPFKTYQLLISRNGLYKFQNDKLELVEGSLHLRLKGIIQKSHELAFAHSDSKIYCIREKNGKIECKEYKLDLENSKPFIISLGSLNQDLWISTKKGVYVHAFGVAKADSPKSRIKFIVDSVSINNTLLRKRGEISAYTGSNLHLFFSVLCFDKKIGRNLEHSLDGSNWFESNRNNFALGNLSAGNYVLRVRLKDAPYTILFKQSIVIENQFFQTLWFQILVYILLSCALVWYLRRLYRNREKKRIIETEKLALELKLLTSKMNPHFTFNTINSIQHYILHSEKKEALKYLSEYAMLIRKSLDFSMEERISLEEEKEFLELYLTLENKRFNSNFQMEFNVHPPEILTMSKIPSMLIQPLVENIVLHANYEENEAKRVMIDVNLIHGFFTIQVSDFGHGRPTNSASKIHKSYGLELIRSRVKMYNGKDYSVNDVAISKSDLLADLGTTITIKLKEWKQY